eukprot:gene9750-1754_t
MGYEKALELDKVAKDKAVEAHDSDHNIVRPGLGRHMVNDDVLSHTIRLCLPGYLDQYTSFPSLRLPNHCSGLAHLSTLLSAHNPVKHFDAQESCESYE